LGFADGPNLYAYVHNNPLTRFDLYGLIESNDEDDLIATRFLRETLTIYVQNQWSQTHSIWKFQGDLLSHPIETTQRLWQKGQSAYVAVSTLNQEKVYAG